MDLNDLPNADILPSFRAEIACGENLGGAVVLDAVGTVATIVFVGVLDGGDEENKSEGEDGSAATEDGELRELVEDGDDEEVDVSNAAELLEKVSWEEGED